MEKKIAKAELEKALNTCARITQKNCGVYKDGIFPQIYTVNGVYPKGENYEWTPGFFTGISWLCWQHTGDDAFKTAALQQVDSFYTRVQNKYCTDNHDLGFLYTPSCTAAYMLTGNEKARQAALMAADELLLRFQEKGQFIQAWGEYGNPAHYRMIIDCLLNVPLLYWASGQTGKEVYREKALSHSKTAIKHLFRADGSTYHTFYFDPETGEPLHGETAQGYSNDTAWARGQAWGVYGLALYYRYTNDKEILPLFNKVFSYFMSHLPPNKIPYWDLSFSYPSNEPWDSSAAAVAACGMLEMGEQLGGEENEKYRKIAGEIAKSLYQNCLADGEGGKNGLLLHGVYNKKSPFNAREDAGVDESNLWGDYFWAELLTRLYTKWEPYW